RRKDKRLETDAATSRPSAALGACGMVGRPYHNEKWITFFAPARPPVAALWMLENAFDGGLPGGVKSFDFGGGFLGVVAARGAREGSQSRERIGQAEA